ncbi:MAG: NUDIX hydrolase [Gemmatimonadetes bacterium]|jgi:ADP-ribose pyrophosphatase YjhB (NUDIX family)|nr:NUDIX hydrolase [Gemmatimonadota bacterium]
MSSQQPTILDSTGKRQFACSAVAVSGIIVNQESKILLLSSPVKNEDGSWQVISGALEARETILDGTLREIGEEAGEHLRVRPLGTVHVHTFNYEERVQYMIGIYYLLAYEGGSVQPGDDMRGSQFRWWSVEELVAENIKLKIPPGGIWILERAVELYHLWGDQTNHLSRDQARNLQ